MSSIIDKAPTLDDCTTANIKLNKVGEIIEKEELHWPEYKNSDSKREYHGQVRGLILNEIIRRIDPQVGFFSFLFIYLLHFENKVALVQLCKSILKVTDANFEEVCPNIMKSLFHENQMYHYIIHFINTVFV